MCIESSLESLKIQSVGYLIVLYIPQTLLSVELDEMVIMYRKLERTS
jgi:hypothetical protein